LEGVALVVHVVLTRRPNGLSLGTFQKLSVLSQNYETLDKKLLTFMLWSFKYMDLDTENPSNTTKGFIVTQGN
jgi:hypothetical protein